MHNRFPVKLVLAQSLLNHNKYLDLRRVPQGTLFVLPGLSPVVLIHSFPRGVVPKMKMSAQSKNTVCYNKLLKYQMKTPVFPVRLVGRYKK